MNRLKEANANSHPANRWMFEVWEQPLSKVGNGTKVVAGVIAACAWNGKDTANPSYRTISECSGQSSKTISKAIKQLTAAGLIAVEKKKSKAGIYNSYRLTFPMTTEDLLSLEGKSSEVASPTNPLAFPMGTTRFPHEDRSLYPSTPEALNETLNEARIEAIEEKTMTTPKNNILKEKVEEAKGNLPLDYSPRMVGDHYPDIIEEAKKRYLFLTSLGLTKDRNYQQVKRWFENWVSEDSDPMITTTYFLIQTNSISRLTGGSIEKWLRSKNDYFQNEPRYWVNGELLSGFDLNEALIKRNKHQAGLAGLISHFEKVGV